MIKKYINLAGSNLLFLFVCLLLTAQFAYSADSKKDIYQVLAYKLKNNEQVQRVDSFLKDAYLPALHRLGIAKIGVFKPITNDTASVKMIYAVIPFHSLAEWSVLPSKLEKDLAYKTAAKAFFEARADNPSYERIESTLLEALTVQPAFMQPSSKATTERVYELRSYESPTENLFSKKLAMFNEAGETEIFKRLGFDAIFYAKVISGCHMPNLMYMTYYENLQSRNEHWKSFGSDPGWKELSGRPEFENKVSVSHIDSILMNATGYSDL